MADSKDPIERAIESAENLIASLRVREKAGLSEDTDGSQFRTLSSPMADPEQSLFLLPAEQSLISEGAAFQWPSNKTASSQVTLPQLEDFSPKQSLHALVTKVTDSVVLESPTVETLQRVLQERDKDIEVAAKLGQFLLYRNETLEADLTRTLDQKSLLEKELRHCQQAMVKKEELLRLYASEQQEEPPTVGGAQPSKAQAEWVQVLSEECRELRESNVQLQAEADQLKKATTEVEVQERELVQHCMEQFSEAKKRLAEVREEAEHKDDENRRLLGELKHLHGDLVEVQSREEERVGEVEILKEQLTDLQEQHINMAQHVGVVQESLEEATVLLKETREENAALKEMAANQTASSPADSGHVEHESIVKEIEEVLRKEIVAASMLTERPRSPNNYAQQRTMVVMETVRAATLASSRRQRRQKLPPPSEKTLPLATSSPQTSIPTALNGLEHKLSLPGHLVSPVSGRGSDKLQEELIRYRQQNYVSPEKLQIVKPLEGSVTLLKWKLLASPQLGGASTYFSDASRPGVHLKKWKAGGIQDADYNHDNSQSLSPSSVELNRTNMSEEVTGTQRLDLQEHNGNRLGGGVASWLENSTPVLPTSQQPTAPSKSRTPQPRSPAGLRSSADFRTPSAPKTDTSSSSGHNMSLLGQVGSFLGAGWSRLGRRGTETPDSVVTDEERPASSEPGANSGLAGLLDLDSTR